MKSLKQNYYMFGFAFYCIYWYKYLESSETGQEKAQETCYKYPDKGK